MQLKNALFCLYGAFKWHGRRENGQPAKVLTLVALLIIFTFGFFLSFQNAWATEVLQNEQASQLNQNVVQLRAALAENRDLLIEQSADQRTRMIPNLSLPDDLLFALEEWLRITRNQLNTFSHPDQVQAMSIRAFASHLNQVRYSSLSPSSDRLLNQAHDSYFHPQGPIAQWLWDEGLNPILVGWLRTPYGPTDQASDHFADFARGLNAHPEELARRWAYIPRVLESSSSLGASGLVDRDVAHRIFTERAFNLNERGRPLTFEPLLSLALDLSDILKLRAALLASSYPQRLAGHFTEYFKGRDQALSWMIDQANVIELLVLDLQGINDSIRYKATLAKNARELFEIEQELAKYQVKRMQLTNKLQKLRDLLERANLQDFWQFYRAYKQLNLELNKDLVHLRGNIFKTIHQLDEILGVAHDPEKAIAQDTPFEIQFLLERQAAELAGLGNHWENVRNHQYLVKEKEYTEEWTYQVPRTTTDKDGKTKTEMVTKTHYRNWTDYEYNTFQTPPEEWAFRRELIDFDKQIRQASTQEELHKLQLKGQQLLRNVATYAAEEPRGDRDYSDKYQTRNLLLVQMARGLLAKVSLRQLQNGSFLAEYRRSPSPLPQEIAQIMSSVQNLNRRMRSVRNWTTGIIATGLATSAGCLALIQGGHL